MKKQAHATSQKVPSPARSPKLRVLIVDDHTLVRRGMLSVLAEVPDLVVVDMTANANALAAMQSHKPDVVVLDLTVQGAQGLDLIKQLAYDSRTKILAVDLNSEPTYATRAIKLGARGYVTGNVDESLAPAIRRVHSGSLHVSDDVAQQMVATLTGTPASNTSDPMGALSDRELQLAEHVARGLTNTEIHKAMGISIKTVETHKAHIKKKLGVAKSSQLTRYCVQWFEQRNAATK